jgi:hypothetical protein
MHQLTMPTDGPLPLFFRIAEAHPRLRYYLFGWHRPEARIDTLSWYRRFLLMIILVHELDSRRSGQSRI